MENTSVQEPLPVWLSYLNEKETNDLVVAVGQKPSVYKSYKNPATGYIEVQKAFVSDKETKKGEFYYEMAQIFSTKKEWKKFFAGKDVYLKYPNDPASLYRLRAYFITDTQPGVMISKVSEYSRALTKQSRKDNYSGT